MECDNMTPGEIAVVVVLAIIVCLIIVYLVKKRKSGAGVCNGDCSQCGGCSHSSNNNTKQK